MPPWKQPAPLWDLSMNFLVDLFWTHFDKCSTEGSIEKLRAFMTVMKKDICPRIPRELEPKFYDRFVIKSWKYPRRQSREYPDDHLRLVIELVMDRPIVGLKCQFHYLPLNPDDAHRIQGLVELCLGNFQAPVPYSLRTFQLKDLTVLDYIFRCTDDDLIVLEKNWPKLQRVNVRSSESVTDVGLRALIPCSNLSSLCATSC